MQSGNHQCITSMNREYYFLNFSFYVTQTSYIVYQTKGNHIFYISIVCIIL